MTVNTHNLIVDFGKHKGERWTRLPISYLKWLINDGTQYANIARSELERRGHTELGDMEISGHAIDRASLFCWKVWKETKNKDEGLHAWLYRIALEALERGEVTGEEKEGRVYMGLRFVYEFGDIYPTLKTVINKKYQH
jgi:hypothetical protein